MVKRALVLVTALRWALEDCAGLALFKRAILAAQKGGIEEFYIVTRESIKLRPLLQDPRLRARFHWVEEGLSEEFFKPYLDRLMVIKAETVFDSGMIEEVRSWEMRGEVALLAVRDGKAEMGTFVKVDGEEVAGLTTEAETDTLTAGILLVRAEVLKELTISSSRNPMALDELIQHLCGKGSVRAVNVSDEVCQEVTSVETLKNANKLLYKQLGLPTDGLWSTFVNRRASGLLTKLLVRLPITPNQITICSLLVGMVACWFFWKGGYWNGVFAALLYQVAIIIDLSDGEVARLKFMQSSFGAWLDSVCDSLVYAGIFLSVALALERQGYDDVLLAGLAAAISVFICLNLDAYLLMREAVASNPPSQGTATKPSRVSYYLEKLANVDTFQVILFIFVFSGQFFWFIWGMAMGWTAYLSFSLSKLFFGWLKDKRAASQAIS